MENLSEIIARNICNFRKKMKMTQSELAEKLNFSDKSVSKWERGESVPDVSVLMSLCEIFNITLNDIVSESPKAKTVSKANKTNKLIITLLSSGLVWLIATITYTCLILFNAYDYKSWLSFIYAIPLSSIVLLVFSCVWGTKYMQFIFSSIIVWTCFVSVCLTIEKMWYLLFICIPLQLLLILWFLLKKRNSN